ncbi:hypothetical protein BDR26DRAFT_865490 [Obelidium mucronatum]|nr:hypothetical protein BDR26DRAFT_865490 [Obelidium mucronatum]
MEQSRNVKEVLTELIMRVGRSYYKEHFIMILDLLALKGAIKEEDMAQSLRLSPGDTRKLCKKLEFDRLVKSSTTISEQKHFKHTKRISKTFYYIDYKSFLNVIRFKMFKIQEMIRKEIDEHNNNLSYECSKCKTKFDPFAVLRLIRPEDGMFVCEYCPEIVLEQEKGTDFENDLSKRFNEERGPILRLLQQTDQAVIPEFTPPSSDAMAASSAQGSSTQMLHPSLIKVELEGFNDDLNMDSGSNATPGGADADGYDEEGFAIDNKDALMQEYYARLQQATAAAAASSTDVGGSSGGGWSFLSNASAAPATTVESAYGGMNGSSSSGVGFKRDIGDDDLDSVGQKRGPAANDDSDLDDEEFVEL